MIALLILFKTQSLVGATVPIGISFYSFEAISYLFDLRQKRLAEPRFHELALYLLFWPTVVSGPILRGREFFPQLAFDAPLDARLFVSGIDRILWGLVQKNVVANTLGHWVGVAFASDRGAWSTLDAWTAAVAYGLQIYFDFAAYSNMAIGSAQLIGIRMPENFRFPYHAATPPEFWSRWHMSLSRWIRDYLFFPLNAKYRGAPTPLFLSLIGVMALVGLWHGAGAGFLLWGVLHGCYLVIYRIYEDLVTKRRPQMAEARAARLIWRGATLVAVFAAWIPFRAAGPHQAMELLRSMFLTLDASTTFPPVMFVATLAAIAFCVAEPAVLGWISTTDEKAAAGKVAAIGRLALRPLAYFAGLLLFLSFGEQPAQFIYFQF